MYIDKKNGGHEPFLLSLVINNLILHNYMLDFGAFANVMPLRVTQRLEMDITKPYKNGCGFESKSLPVHGLIKDAKVSLATNNDISVLMDIVGIDVPDAWGMLLSRKWCGSFRGQLQMDLCCATVSTFDRIPFVLYRELEMPDHVEDMEPFPFHKPI